MAVLQRFCLENGIPVPATASKEEIEAFITRAILNGRTLKPDAEIGCFGFWGGDEDTTCLFCIYKEECAKVSLGMDAKKYRAFVRRLENPKFSIETRAARASARKNNRVVRRHQGERES